MCDVKFMVWNAKRVYGACVCVILAKLESQCFVVDILTSFIQLSVYGNPKLFFIIIVLWMNFIFLLAFLQYVLEIVIFGKIALRLTDEASR